jgi:soluble lytic murein transglycosylase-like protein
VKLLAAAGAGLLALIVLVVALLSAGPGANASGVSPALAGAPPGLVAVAFKAGEATGIDPNLLLAVARVETD